MGKYLYQAKQLGGRVVTGQLEAANEVEARVKLRAQQMIPLQVGEKKAAAEKGTSDLFSFFKQGVSSKELQIFTRQFATLINSGIPVVQGLEILENSSKNPTLKGATRQIRADISTGKKLAEAMQNHSTIFDRLYVNLVRAGEEGGVLDTILNRLAVYIEKSVKIKNKVIGAMYYPVGILFVAFCVIVVIMLFVIPKFEELFKSAGAELPAPTQMVIDMSHMFQNYWYIGLGAIVASFFGIKNYYATPSGKIVIDNILLSTPIFGPLLQKSAIARFTGTLSTLLSCGVSILDALDIAARVSGNSVIERTLLAARTVISEGKSITTPLSQDKYIPEMVTHMIGVGEQTGALDTMLGKIADFYEEEVDYAVGALTSMIEPMMMMFLGVGIGGLVIALYLPIFNLAGTVK